MKKLIAFSLLLLCISFVKADHITGGQMYYTSVSASNGNIRYSVTLKLYMRCGSGRMFPDPIIVSVFNRTTHVRITDVSVVLTNQQTIQLTDAGPCIVNPPKVCYVIATYEFDITLPQSTDGYILSSQVNYRIAGITNLTIYNNIGATYTCEIPGTSGTTDAPHNNSAKFIGSDLVIVCANNRFSYSFEASDWDNDQLKYSFCEAYISGTSAVGNIASPPTAPPYVSVPYGRDFGASNPLGSNVTIDENTGLITGAAPATGVYVVTVCVREIRNGIVIATQRKDLQINVADCDIAAALLEPEYQLCRNSKTLNVVNLSNSPLIKTQDWEIKNRAGANIYSTTAPAAHYTFTDTGLYSIKLVINRNEACTDSATSLVRVYPGFFPAFTYSGVCFNKPTNFKNSTTTVYGTVISWNWDFGESPNAKDTSILENPSYTYETMGVKAILLTTTNSNGCRDTAMQEISIFDKPPLNLAFFDTLICVGDKVKLITGGSGSYQWSPAVNIDNSSSPSPTVSPVATTKYYVDLNDQGCLNRDSVLVRVTDHVTLQTMNDTVVCQGDPVQLHISSDGFKFSWTPASQIVNPNVANPIAVTNVVTTYQVTAMIGSCSATDEVTVTPVPYPFVSAGPDTVICFNTAAQLHAATDGSSYVWAPPDFLTNSNSLNPIAKPSHNTLYILSAFDNKGCPKAGVDSVLVTVLPDINAFAGNDTSVVIGQDLQLQAGGGTAYLWSPSTDLSSRDIANPMAHFDEPSDKLHYTVVVSNEAGCSDSASINIKVFATLPSVFVPNAFTPNNDGRNDVLRPITAGMKRLEYFSVYNRDGRLMFTTHENNKGWDGTDKGVPQDSATFVWMVKAIDYKGKVYFQKGTSTLIR